MGDDEESDSDNNDGGFIIRVPSELAKNKKKNLAKTGSEDESSRHAVDSYGMGKP